MHQPIKLTVSLASIQREPWHLACPFSVPWCRTARVLRRSQCRTPTACPSWRSSSGSNNSRQPHNSRVGWWEVQARHRSSTTHRSPPQQHCQATLQIIPPTPSHPYDPRHACHTGLGELWHRPSVAVSFFSCHYIYAFSRHFIQSDLVKSGYTFLFYFYQYVVRENWTHNLCPANAMLCHHLAIKNIVDWLSDNTNDFELLNISEMIISSALSTVYNFYILCLRKIKCIKFCLRNIVSTVNLGCKLDLKTIALRARNAEYNPKVRLVLIG